MLFSNINIKQIFRDLMLPSIANNNKKVKIHLDFFSNYLTLLPTKVAEPKDSNPKPIPTKAKLLDSPVLGNST